MIDQGCLPSSEGEFRNVCHGMEEGMDTVFLDGKDMLVKGKLHLLFNPTRVW